MKLGKGETTNPLNVISNLIAKDKKKWTRQEQEDYEISFSLLSYEDREEVTGWLEETPSIYLK